MKVCKQFGLQDMIERESETIDTQLGFWFEVGGRYARACLLFFMLILALMLKMMLIAVRILSFGLREAVKCGKI
jgi:hypothetical protein